MNSLKPTTWWHFAVIATTLTIISSIVWNEAILLFVTSIFLWIFCCLYHMGKYVKRDWHLVAGGRDEGEEVILAIIGMIILVVVIYNTHDIAVWIIYVIKGIPWVVWKVLTTITLLIVGFVRHSIWGS